MSCPHQVVWVVAWCGLSWLGVIHKRGGARGVFRLMLPWHLLDTTAAEAINSTSIDTAGADSPGATELESTNWHRAQSPPTLLLAGAPVCSVVTPRSWLSKMM